MTVTRNPNGSTGHVEPVVSNFIDQDTAAQAVCEAPAGAGTFTIPAHVLLALPATNSANFFFQLRDVASAYSGPYSATGVTAGIAQTFVDGVALGGVTLQ
jgi:hypothetical protein